MNHVSPTRRPVVGRSRAPGPGSTRPSSFTSYPSSDPVLPLEAPRFSAPAASRSSDSATPLLCPLGGSSWNGQLPLLFLCPVKAHHPWGPHSYAHLGSLSTSPWAHCLPWTSTPLPFLSGACPISCLGVFLSWMHGSLPASHKYLEDKNHFGSSSEVPAGPHTKQVLRNICSFIHSFTPAIMIHSEHLWSPYYVAGTASVFVVPVFRGEDRQPLNTCQQ